MSMSNQAGACSRASSNSRRSSRATNSCSGRPRGVHGQQRGQAARDQSVGAAEDDGRGESPSQRFAHAGGGLSDCGVLVATAMKRFEYFEPKTLDDAVSLLSLYDGKADVLAGGTDLLVEIKEHV